MAREWLDLHLSAHGRSTKEAIPWRHGVMKKLTIVLVCVSILFATTGCQRGRFFRRGARCGAPTFKMPSLQSAPCNNGCSTTLPPNGSYESIPQTGFSESQRLIDGEHVMNYPIYTEGPVISNKTVVGPETEIPEIP